MKQQSFTEIEYENRKRRTKRDEFLERMERLIPWKEWCAIMGADLFAFPDFFVYLFVKSRYTDQISLWIINPNRSLRSRH